MQFRTPGSRWVLGAPQPRNRTVNGWSHSSYVADAFACGLVVFAAAHSRDGEAALQHCPLPGPVCYHVGHTAVRIHQVVNLGMKRPVYGLHRCQRLCRIPVRVPQFRTPRLNSRRPSYMYVRASCHHSTASEGAPCALLLTNHAFLGSHVHQRRKRHFLHRHRHRWVGSAQLVAHQIQRALHPPAPPTEYHIWWTLV